MLPKLRHQPCFFHQPLTGDSFRLPIPNCQLWFCCVSWDFLDMEMTNYQPLVNWFGARWFELGASHWLKLSQTLDDRILVSSGFVSPDIFRGSQTPFFGKTEAIAGHSGPPGDWGRFRILASHGWPRVPRCWMAWIMIKSLSLIYHRSISIQSIHWTCNMS